MLLQVTPWHPGLTSHGYDSNSSGGCTPVFITRWPISPLESRGWYCTPFHSDMTITASRAHCSGVSRPGWNGVLLEKQTLSRCQAALPRSPMLVFLSESGRRHIVFLGGMTTRVFRQQWKWQLLPDVGKQSRGGADVKPDSQGWDSAEGTPNQSLRRGGMTQGWMASWCHWQPTSCLRRSSTFGHRDSQACLSASTLSCHQDDEHCAGVHQNGR